MTHRRSRTLASATLFVLIATLTSPAEAEEPADTSSETVEAVDDSLDAVGAEKPIDNPEVAMPDVAEAGVVIGSDYSSAIVLDVPAVGAGDVIGEGDTATTVYDGTAPGTQIAVQDTRGGVRALVHIENGDAPERFDFSITGAATELRLREDGGVDIFDAAGEPIGDLDAPWAVDANDAAVPTHYEVSGTTLTQVVSHRDGSYAYGIVADPSPNVWGACGLNTSPTKIVDQYSRKGGGVFYLRCGDANSGYKHILARHRTDFENLAWGTNRNWRDIADMAMTYNASDPDKTVLNVGGGKQCRSRLLFLKNTRTNQVVRQVNFKMITVQSSGNIVTVYPGKC